MVDKANAEGDLEITQSAMDNHRRVARVPTCQPLV